MHNRRNSISLALVSALLGFAGMQLKLPAADRVPSASALRKRDRAASEPARFIRVKNPAHGRRAYAPKGTQSTRQKAARLRHDQRRRAR